MAAAYLAVGVVTLGAGLIGGAADSATDLAIGPAFGFPTTMSFLVLFGFGTAAMALRVRTSPELPAVMGVLVGACGCFCAARLLASGSDPLTDTALLILFSGLMIVLGGQLSARALLRR